jgi:cell division septal protein FtsQ
MKLKPQPRPTRRASTGRRYGAVRRGARAKGRGARRPDVPVRRRLAKRLPSIRRLIAGVGAVAAVAGLVALLNGPWLRVQQVTWDGARYTDTAELASLLEGQQGASVLAVDTRAIGDRLERLPAVAEAGVAASLTGRVTATLVEREVAFVWETRSARLLGSDDGTIFAAIRGDADLAADLAAAPRITDDRRSSRLLTVGDTIPEALLETTMRILRIDPTTLGSRAERVTVHIDDEYGFRLASTEPSWEIAFGVYGTDPRVTSAEAAARLERQVTAVRTLFAEEPEDGIGWVDVRNPGKVYFRAKG